MQVCQYSNVCTSKAGVRDSVPHTRSERKRRTLSSACRRVSTRTFVLVKQVCAIESVPDTRSARKRRTFSAACMHPCLPVQTHKYCCICVLLSRKRRTFSVVCRHAYSVSSRQHTSAYVSIRQHTSAYSALYAGIFTISKTTNTSTYIQLRMQAYWVAATTAHSQVCALKLLVGMRPLS
jgi:hypothetical protein